MKLLTIKGMIDKTGIRCLSGSGRHFKGEKLTLRMTTGVTVKTGCCAEGDERTEQSRHLSLFQVFYG